MSLSSVFEQQGSKLFIATTVGFHIRGFLNFFNPLLKIVPNKTHNLLLLEWFLLKTKAALEKDLVVFMKPYIHNPTLNN